MEKFRNDRGIMVFIVVYIILPTVVVLGGIGCGHDHELAPIDATAPPSAGLSSSSSVENLIHSKAYAGSLIVFVDESLTPELSENNSLTTKDTAKTSDLASLQAILNRYPRAKLQKSLKAHALEESLEENDELERDAVPAPRRKGKSVDWDSVYNIKIEDQAEAAQLFRELNQEAAIEYVYPATIDGLPSLPQLLTMHQSYLRGPLGGGLNAEAAWSRGARGQNVIVVDHEHGMNFDHEDLDMRFTSHFADTNPSIPFSGNLAYTIECFTGPGGSLGRPDCPAHIAHGTAVAGIIGAKDFPGKEGGVTGLAPEAKILSESDAHDPAPSLVGAADGIYPPERRNDTRYSSEIGSASDIDPGTIWVIESQKPWVQTPTNLVCRARVVSNARYTSCGQPCTQEEISSGVCASCSQTESAALGNCAPCSGDANSQYGCMPSTIEPATFWAVHDAIEAGVTVIVGSNGSTNLNRLDEIASGSGRNYINFATATTGTMINGRRVLNSGAIVNGATEGPNRIPTTWSICGDRIDLFAWGQGVVTTGYHPDPANNPGWQPDNTPTPPLPQQMNSYFIDNFGGTSAASAMTAGAAAVVQGYAKSRMGAPTRFLMPEKIKEVLKQSGTQVAPYPEGSACAGMQNTATQPNVDAALTQVDQFLNGLSNGVNTAYQKVRRGEQLTLSEEEHLRSAGIGLICWKQEPHRSDPSCPEEKIWPRWRTARSLDVDGDGRADLVNWKHGEWQLDLSTQQNGTEARIPIQKPDDLVRRFEHDNYGTWDKTLTYTAFLSNMVVPYVHDLNNDGRSDFVLYDKENGKVYIAYMKTSLLKPSATFAWDQVLQYNWTDHLELDPRQSRISRPLFEDYNGDGWIDIAIACSDGVWRVDHSNEGAFDARWDLEQNYLVLDRSPINLTDTLSADGVARPVPGWAYLPFTIGAQNLPGTTPVRPYQAFKIPDAVLQTGRIVVYDLYDPDPYFDVTDNRPHHFGGNDVIPLQIGGFDLSVRDSNHQTWNTTLGSINQQNLNPLGPDTVYGDLTCRPVIADFDGDGFDDRAVACPNEWRIVYSTAINSASSDDIFISQIASDRVRRVPLGYDQSTLSLPGRPYVGGITYERVWELINYSLSTNPTIPPPIPVDMTTYNACIGMNGCN